MSKFELILRRHAQSRLKPYEYVDEMLAGPFKKWRHLHKFHDIDRKQTEKVDEIEFELLYGIFGKLFEGASDTVLEDQELFNSIYCYEDIKKLLARCISAKDSIHVLIYNII